MRKGAHKETYIAWRNMTERTRNPKHPMYHYYGGRGIRVCAEWSEYTTFLRDLGEKPVGTFLDRVNNSGNYEKENCHWVSPVESAANRRLARTNKSGVAGVNRLRGKWSAQGGDALGHVHLYFGDDFFEAVCARKSWEASGRKMPIV